MTKDNNAPSDPHEKPDTETHDTDTNPPPENKKHAEIEALFKDIFEHFDRFGESIFGKDIYGTNERQEEWNQLSSSDRYILRGAFVFGLLSHGIIDDFKDNPHYVAIALGPGPLGTVIALGLCMSYLMRQDERSKELRKKVKEMLDKGLSLDDFEDVIKQTPYGDHPLTVDKQALLTKHFNNIASKTKDLNDDFIAKSKKSYQKFKDSMHLNTYLGAHMSLDDLIGEENTDRVLSAVFNTASMTETGTKKAFNATVPPVWNFTTKAIGTVFREAWESTKTSYSMLQDFGKKLDEGYEYNKKEISDFLKKFSPKK